MVVGFVGLRDNKASGASWVWDNGGEEGLGGRNRVVKPHVAVVGCGG